MQEILDALKQLADDVLSNEDRPSATEIAARLQDIEGKVVALQVRGDDFTSPTRPYTTSLGSTPDAVVVPVIPKKRGRPAKRT